MPSIYHKYTKLGYSVIPNRDDKPQQPTVAWTPYRSRLATVAECGQWLEAGYTNISLVLGSLSGLVALDIDDDTLYNEIQNLDYQPLFAKKGSKGAALFFPYEKQYGAKRLWQPPGASSPACELLSDGQLTTIPPSKHPKGKVYEWLSGYNPIAGAHPNPYGLDTIIAFLDKKYAKPAKVTTITISNSQKNQDSELSLQDASAALAFVDPDCSYEEWIEIGMGLKAEFGDAAFEIWNQWSANGSKYNSGEMGIKWRSFKSEGITMGSVIRYAQEGGYDARRPSKHGENYEGITIGELEPPVAKPEEILIRGKKKVVVFPKELALSAPGTLGWVVNWIVDSSPYPQPVIALAGALALIGALKGHRIRTESTGYDTRTNVYTVGLLGSGQGKGAVTNCIRKLMNEAGASKHLLGNPASGTGLYTSLHDAGGIGLAIFDEFGNTIAPSMSAKAQAHHKEITTLLTELYSVPHEVYVGKQYGNKEGKHTRVDIEQPCLCLLGTSTHGQFFNNISSSNFEDGLIGRMLLFDPGDDGLHEDEVDPEQSMKRPPDGLVAKLINMKRLDLKAHPVNGAITGPILSSIEDGLLTIGMDDDARHLLKETSSRWRRRGNEYYRAGNSACSAVCMRVAENAIKIALIACTAGSITYAEMDWAIRVSEACTEYTLSQLENSISDNAYQKETNQILGFIRSTADCTRTQLSKETKRLGIPKKRQEEVIKHLVEAGLIEEVQFIQDGAGRRPNVFRLL